MAIRLVRKKKPKKRTVSNRMTNSDRFAAEIDIQIRLAKGEKITRGRGKANSWLQDGAEYDVAKVMVPEVRNKKLYGKSAVSVQSANGIAELQELKAQVLGGKMAAKVNALYRKPKPRG